jgi:hypothetical protein
MKIFRIFTVAAIIATAFIFTSAVPSKQSPAEQIVFSGTGNSTLGPFGFWVWSEDEDASNPYHGEANGAIYLYALHLTKHVEGEVEEVGEGSYRMTLSSSDGSIVATLTNVPPVVKGPHNTVLATFSTPSGTGSSTSAVVNVTGPGD